jgi:hypothetical protein
MSDSAADGNQDALELNFVPAWARQPPATGSRTPAAAETARGDRRGRELPSNQRRDRGRSLPPRERRHPAEKTGGRQFERETGAVPAARPAAEPALDIAFLPEKRGLAPLARRLAAAGRAYSLFEVAAQFLSKPDYYAVKIAAPPETPDRPPILLHQCQECKAVFLEEAQAVAHALERHFERYYRRVETEVEPPKGHFVCVARCTLSGELLGPPNFHGYADRMADLHRSRFAYLPLDEYRKKLENVHDPALVERWKESMKRKVAYLVGEGEDQRTFERLAEVERHFREHRMAAAIKSGPVFIVAGTVACEFEDPRLKAAIRQVWAQESRFPLRLSVTLRLAFRRLGLHLFKTADGTTYVTSICPAPLDPARSIPLVREILEWLAANTGVPRAELPARLRPAEAADAAAAQEINQQVRWLRDKGHVIEFSDGKLEVPDASIGRIQLARRPRRENKTRNRSRGQEQDYRRASANVAPS